MKKIYQLLALFTLLVSGCSQDEVIKNQSSSSNSLIYTASFEGSESRTYLNEDGYLRWTANDQISIFGANTYNQQYKFTGETGANSGTFEKVSGSYATGTDLSNHYAIYPYNYQTKISETGVITTTIPSEQTYAVNSFGLGDNTMVAVTADKNDTFLKFKNVGGYLELKLYGDNVKIKSIKMEGNSDEKLAGNATITPVYGGTPLITMANDATATITLDCGEGVTISSTAETATTFLLVVPPTTFESGFTITITDINGSTFTKSTSNKIIVERNMIQPMNAFELKDFIAIAEYHVETAGTLATLIGDENKNTLTNIKISGKLNSTDICYIREMAGSNYGGQITETGALRVLDISNATIVEEADVTYLWNQIGNGQYTFQTENNVIGPFMFCRTKLEKVILPTNITSISDYAFNFCENLKEIVLPNGLETIGRGAFIECKNLISINLPESVTELGPSIFESCSSLTNISIPNNITALNGTFARCSSLTNITIPNSVTIFDNGVFSGCSSLTSIIMPNNITTIGYSSFRNCSSLSNITIPNSVTTIGDYAFNGCTSLTNITIPSTTIGSSAFGGCNSLANITLNNGMTTIYNFAFIECRSLESITIPSTVTSIAKTAFRDCNSLSNIIVEQSNTIYDSRDNCNAIVETATNTLIIGSKNTVIPNNVTIIGDNAFQNTSLTSINIPNGVTSIGNQAFSNCSFLESITIPNSVTTIGYHAFKNCTSLIKVDVKATYPPTIDDSFYGCRNDMNIYVPSESLADYHSTEYWKDLNLLTE